MKLFLIDLIDGLLLKRMRGYRLVDQVVTVRVMALASPLRRRFEHRFTPEFARKQAMDVESILR